MRFGIASLAMAMTLAGCTANYVGDVEPAAQAADAVTLVTPPPHDPAELQVLFWSDEQRAKRFRAMEQWFAGHEVAPAPEARALPDGKPLDPALATEIRAYIERSNAAGVMVLQDGKKRFEAYRLGFGPKQRWTSFSVAKSFTSTLLGAAVQDGFIASLDEPVTRYIPGLKGSAYDGVTVEQLATMTSGVKWNEDYTDPNSDVAQMNRFLVEYGPDAIVTQMRGLEREAPPGEKWVYKTGETNLIGVLVENAVGLPLAEYAKSKIVDPAGFAGGMFWMTDPRGGNTGGCCLSLRLSDYTRMGQFVLEGGHGAVPEGWFANAGSAKVAFGPDEMRDHFGPGVSGYGYGYQWWNYGGATFGAQGIFGQAITIVPEKRLVLAAVSNWPTASNAPYRNQWLDLARKIAAAD